MGIPVKKPLDSYSGRYEQSCECPACGKMFWQKAKAKPSPLPVSMLCDKCYPLERRKMYVNEYVKDPKLRDKRLAYAREWRKNMKSTGRLEEYRKNYRQKEGVKEGIAANKRLKNGIKTSISSFFTRFMPPGRVGEETAIKKRVRRL